MSYRVKKRTAGVAPASTGWEPAILLLNYIRAMRRVRVALTGGFRPTDLQSAPALYRTTDALEKRMVGFAPTASTLARSRSTVELHPHFDDGHARIRAGDRLLVGELFYC